ncbi:hypothetical protein ID866_5777 [Astraeus odoratus]|nr:hypothetical protein ID866_5777 [Astraeus odoratus]
MRLTSLFGIFFAAPLVPNAAASYKGYTHKVKESLEAAPHGWVQRVPAPPDHVLELQIALPQPYFPILEQHLWEISDPNHNRYGAHLSKEETFALMGPHPDSLNAVSEWLASYGIYEEHRTRSSAMDWVTIRVPVSLAEEMFDTKYYVYVHASTGESIIRTTSYSLPEILHEHIELVQPTTMFARFKALGTAMYWATNAQEGNVPTESGTITGPAGNLVDASCNSSVWSPCITQLYNAVNYSTSATNGNKIGIAGYALSGYPSIEDLQLYYKAVNPAAVGSNFTIVLTNGVENQSVAAGEIEPNLDTQIAFALTYPTPAYFYMTTGSPPFRPDVLTPNNTNEPFSATIPLRPSVLVTVMMSKQAVPVSYARRVCSGMAALGARGISLLFSSGDGGVGDYDTNPATQVCFTNHGHNQTRFIPVFPASCPYVTAVGATRNIPEVGAGFSGGGFSDYFQRPGYQKDAVPPYLDLLGKDTYKGLFNRNGRAIPDVSAQGYGYPIYYQGQLFEISGTSTSTPTFAAIISMLNDARLNAGKSPLGFLNPWLYSKGFTALNDITVGNNIGCGTQGFNATEGWDPVTGLGTPNFEKLKKLALTLP